ncbi:hypothetical protein LXL04_013335 [Taraxacum kok-saghyz]
MVIWNHRFTLLELTFSLQAKCLETSPCRPYVWKLGTVAIKKVLEYKRYKNREQQTMRLLDHQNFVLFKHCFLINNTILWLCCRKKNDAILNEQYGKLKRCGTDLQESHIPDLMKFVTYFEGLGYNENDIYCVVVGTNLRVIRAQTHTHNRIDKASAVVEEPETSTPPPSGK